MPLDTDQFDFFVSYARKDNSDGWITRFVEELLAVHRKFACGRELTFFFDKNDIHGLSDWREQIFNKGLAHSRLFVAFVSPSFFASEWCRREWRAWIDLEIAQHILTAGAAPIYVVEVPGFGDGRISEQEVARKVAELCELAGPDEEYVGSASAAIHQLRRRQLSPDRAFFTAEKAGRRQYDAVQPF